MNELEEPFMLAPFRYALQVWPDFDALAIGMARGAAFAEDRRCFA